jgi:hypothetical protein
MTAHYFWPNKQDLGVDVVGSGRPLLAVGLCPHANEPLGSAFAATVGGYRGELGTIALVGPIDPPPLAYRFRLPCDPVTYVADGYLQPLPDQVEFAHCAVPSSPAQRRAAEFRACLRELAPDALVLLHNDVGAQAPYLYANYHWPQAERKLIADSSDVFPEWPGLDADWTHQISDRTYAFFPCDRIGVLGTESAGLSIEREIGVPTLTLELPIFDWGTAGHARTRVLDAVGDWIARGAKASDTGAALVAEVAQAVGAHEIRMIAPEITARMVWSVLAGLRMDLAAGWRSGMSH